MLQPNPHYAGVRRGLPAFAQAALLDLYTPTRPQGATFLGKPYPARGMQGAFRAWRTALQDGQRVAFLFPGGYSLLRQALVEELRQFSGAAFYAWDSVAEPRHSTFPELDALVDETLGEAVRYETGMGTLAELTAALPQTDVLFIFTPADPAGLNPAFAQALQQTSAETIRFCRTAADTTARLCRYTVPHTHFAEEWGAEADAYGNLCLQQPLTLPLRPAVAEAEALHCLLTGEPLPLVDRPELSPVRARLQRLLPQFDSLLRHGIAEGAAPRPLVLPRVSTSATIVPYLHPLYADGRFAHNPWLRETWFPLSGYAGAAEVFVPGEGGECAARVGGALLPACAVPGLAHTCIPLDPQTVGHSSIEIVPEKPLPHRDTKPLPPQSTGTPPPHGHESTPQWALLIDTSLCNGCTACTLACRAENNIPTVGQEDLARHRDLQWLRLERYQDADGSRLYQPLACRQCENSPCEAVCPVHATVHTDEGLNAMVYPRCWGTRYCAAACPYEARHFNYRDYAQTARAATAAPANPQVSLRSRGVMEKCNYCIQRINAARRDGSTPQTACQQACPRGAIRLVDLRQESPTRIQTTFDAPGTTPRTLYLPPHQSD